MKRVVNQCRVEAKQRFSDYENEISNAEKNVVAAEKKLSKSKENLQKLLDQKIK